MTDIVPENGVSFENGQPGFAYTTVYRCFPNKSNGLLFRLVNEGKKQWAFYNDTTDLIFRVHAKFGAESVLKALARTAMESEGENGGFVASCTVHPGRTERFIEGSVNGFELDFLSESAPAEDVTFENGHPTVAYDAVYKCFKGHGNGLLFRLVAEDVMSGEQTWSYYNDTTDFVMAVEVRFADGNGVQPLGKTSVTASTEEAVVFRLQIEPRTTEVFLRGDPRDFNQSFVADPVVNEIPEDPNRIVFTHGGPNPDVITYPATRVYRAFKNNGNGLMFLIIDAPEKKWAFYNDTAEYNITAKVVFAPGSLYTPAEKAKVMENPEVEGGTICEIIVPPVTTELFILDGNPQNYQLSFAADPLNKSLPETRPSYENGGPDMGIFPNCDKVYKCFKEHGNGLLFRIVDEQNRRWGFYNDTKDVVFTIKVTFDKEATVQELGKTQQAEDAELGVVFVLEVQPLTTELFVEGDVTAFTTKFSGRKCKAVH